MAEKYPYERIIVNTVHGSFISDKCDYHVEDGILTVFRDNEFKDYSYVKRDFVMYYKFEKHYPMGVIVEIQCLTKL